MSESAVRVEVPPAGPAVLTIDQPEAKVNVLTPALWHELRAALEGLAGRTDVPGLIVRSGKPGSFVAGADIKGLADARPDDPEPARRLVGLGRAVLATLADLPFPTVAAIEGPCLGGGLEVTLACDARVASLHARTELGLPEVKLGLIPGWGGTQRLTRLVGPAVAAEVICFARNVGPERARAVGLVDEAVGPELLLPATARLIERFRADPAAWRAVRDRKSAPVGMTRDGLALLADDLGRRLRARTRGHEPAPEAALRVILAGCDRPLAEGLALEAEAFVPLVGSEVSRNLIAVFFLRQRFARETFGLAPTAARTFTRVGVVGAGVMGSGIASVLLRRGVGVVLTDASPVALARGGARIADAFREDEQRGRLSAADREAAMLRLSAVGFVEELAGCGVVIEAVPEDETLKRDVFSRLAASCPTAILATNTSTLSVSRLAEGAPAPERVAGLHFFNPAERMELVEVVRGPRTDDATAATLVALARRAGKVPVLVRDAPGFLVNRVLFPYLSEALVLLEEGATPEAVDAAAEGFGMPCGPVRLCDLVGLDVTRAALAVLEAAYPDRARPTRVLEVLTTAGRLGRKSGAGFHAHARGTTPAGELLARCRREDRTHPPEELLDRLLLPLVAEAVRVLEDGVADSAAAVDLAMILGTGFPAFRGGPLRWADGVGLAEIVARLRRYAGHGGRFAVPALLGRLAASGGRFHASA